MVYDTFIFFNELELLELRLNELSDVVDRFILVEATRTFTNKPKPLYYAENKHLFSKFNHKITHIIVEDLPESDNPWILERFQRNCISRGFNNMSDDDIIMISDTDEIPRAEIVKEVTNKLKSENKNSLIHNIIHKIYKSEFLINLFKHIGF
jgi:beta-1,4-mannosyl-glycoprotein beta-1,4-N-acetylglucosaminyltransferase